MLDPATESQSGTPSAGRLVIRVKLIPPEPPPPPVQRRLSKSALLLILGVGAVLLSWLGIRIFKTTPTSPPAAAVTARSSDPETPAPLSARTEDSPVVSDEPRPKPAAAVPV